ncbi:DUF4062 domain-containing protein [Ornithinimicrobium ciconiae]|uniref:DUF4062 domain-containing protein n=1 Tax=Ornithinimicrobium ciconiae TaxID=2594265 RepID=A0A516GAN4_9MICO|nr:DUF4062 domain-containing protein [Ornithinimicrobium ciconiae]QDO88565.1 DUF4062 domain-containing protein [Ornithinimicrobium ciconiae]
MPIQVSCRQIFLASPGGLGPERSRCRDVFRQHNESRAVAERLFFYVHAWEDVPGGVGRPQDLINPNLDECDYLLMLLYDKWGSPPNNDDTFSSGTEEEFFRALNLLADGDRPMRDVLVLFKTVDPERIPDAGPQLKAVLDFRARLEASKSLMYETFDSDESLRRIVERKMRAWLDDDGAKVPRKVEIPQASVDTAGARTREHADLLESARTLAADGLRVQAEAAFAGATETGEPESLLEFGQFMRRTGRLEQAMALNRRVVQDPQLLVNRGSRAVGLRVRAMSNIGVIQRQLGKLSESVATLQEAVDTAEQSRDPVPSEKCYALDNYGISLMRAGASDGALEQFEQVARIRAEFGSVDDRAQSEINIGRYHLGRGEFEEALARFCGALRLLSPADGDPHLPANAYAGQAEALIRLARDEEADGALEAARQANERLHNKKGMSIVHGLWARSLLQRERPEDARPHIDAAATLVDETGDAVGRVVVTWLEAESARQQGDLPSARVLANDVASLLEEVAEPWLQRDLDDLLGALQPV